MNESINEEDYQPNSEIVGKYEKAHERGIIGVWSFSFGGQIGVLSVSHDCSKIWVLDDGRSGKLFTIEEKMVLASWRHAVQTADVSRDGQYAVIIGMNSMIHELEMTSEVKYLETDLGYLEAVHCAISPLKTGFITASFAGFLADVSVHSGKVIRKEPFPSVKSISCMKYSRDAKYVAIGQIDGAVELYHADTFKSFHKYEVHSMRVRKIEFLPGNEQFLTACDDRLIKLNSLVDFGHEADHARSTKAIRVYSAHDSPVTGLTIDERSGGTRFASSSASAQIFIWHIELTTPIMIIANEHTATVSGLSFSPTGRHLLSGGDDAIMHIYSIPGSGESPEHETFYAQLQEPVEMEQTTTEYNHQNGSSTHYEQEEVPSEEGVAHHYYTSQAEEYKPDAQPADQYQEYNPYAEPRTPPQEEEDEDIGDYVYNATTENADYQSKTPPIEDQYNPEV